MGRCYSRHWIILAVIACTIGLASACANGPGDDPPDGQGIQPGSVGTRELPTLYPTVTPLPSASPEDTRPAQPTSPPATEIAFDQLVVEVTYSVPAIGLERRIRGNVAGEIEVIDESSGTTTTLKNRPGVVVEMQQALPRASVEDLPADCDYCVVVEYELPLTNQSGQGWLNDVQLLASLENFTAAALGPHFPPGTIAGLRREATPFEVAHSAAITADGELWAWTAIDAQLPEPRIAEGVEEQAVSQIAAINWSSLPATIGFICYEGGGTESLFLDSPDGGTLVDIRCPELYLPGQLMPIYGILSEAVQGQLEGGDVNPPHLPMNLGTLVLFRRADGAMLDLRADGTLRATDVAGMAYTSTLTSTQVLSFTSLLADSTLLQAGPSAIFEEEPGNVILLRRDDDVYEFSWDEDAEAPETLAATWNSLLEQVIQGSSAEGDVTPTPAVTATPTDSS